MMKTSNNNKISGESRSGVVLAVTLLVVLVISIIAGGFFTFTMSSTESAKRWRESDYAFLTAQNALEISKKEIFDKFSEYYVVSPLSYSAYKFDWFGDSTETPSTTIGCNGYEYTTMTNRSVLYGTASVVIEGVNQNSTPVRGPCDIKLTAIAKVGDSSCTLTEVVRYQLRRSKVFDYGYFVNNFGWLWGDSITATGDVRANADFSFKYGPNLYGNAYAAANAEIGASGIIDGSYDAGSLEKYLTYNYGDWLRARPGSPTYLPEDEDDVVEYWDMGYEGNPTLYEYNEPVEMPYLGDLAEYKYLANQENGTISYPEVNLTSGGYTIDGSDIQTVDAVYDGAGPDGVSGTADDGCLVLIGTYDHPIVIDGPVVVEGDLIIKGYFTGQGTIYVGRNTHVAGDLLAVDPPVWSKPDTDPTSTAEANKSKDLISLAAKGNTVLGDYTDSSWYNAVKSYMYPNGSFCQPYETDASDYDNGYDSDNNPNNGYEFDGDYRQYDGGYYVYNESKGSSAYRRYYQSSINPSRFSKYADNNKISQIDAVLYNNHLITGYVGGTTFNGGIISRNEAINFTGGIQINWDIRLGSTSKDAVDMDIYLPVSLAPPETRFWYQQ